MGSTYKIYTKGGDKGETSLLGGTRVPKYHERIEAYGTVDELVSYLGLIRDQDIAVQYKHLVINIQQVLFTAEAHLASDSEKNTANLPQFTEKEIELLESEIDTMNEVLPELRSFILPGGHQVVSHCHIARTICRRAERLVIKLSQNHAVNILIIKYLNRLSDYLFVLARKLAHDLRVEETPWIPNK
jgi:cob(I)alamin adenosyltransferase